MLKVSIPTVSSIYSTLMNDTHIFRILAFFGGYSRQEANTLLVKNPNLIVSFSRTLLSDLSTKQTPAEFDKLLATAINEIYKALV